MEAKEIAEGLKAHNRKELTLPNSGLPFYIRRLQPWDFLGMPGIPTGSVLSDGNETRVHKRDYAEERKAAENIVRLAAAFPRVCAEGAFPADDEIAVQDLGDDLEFVLDEIVTFARLKTESQVVEKFRGEEKAVPPAG